MPQIVLTEEQIKALASSSAAFNYGVYYHSADRVKSLFFSPQKRVLTAVVFETLLHNVQVSFDLRGLIQDYQCTCSEFKAGGGACKHIVAVLKAAQKNLSYMGPEAQDRAVQEFLAFLAGRLEGPKEHLTLEVELQIFTGYRKSANLLLKVGQQRLYVVKNFADFLTALRTGEQLEFGKNFTFDPMRHDFTEQDKEALAFLQEMFEQQLALKEMQGSYFIGSLFSQKFLPLTGYYLAKLLDVLGDKEFQLCLGQSVTRSQRIIRQGLPLGFSLQDMDQDMAFALEGEELPLQLTADGRYYLYQRNVYQATPAQKEVLPVMLKTLKQGFSTAIVVSKRQKERFASEALPLLGDLGQVSIDPALAEKFNRENLQANIYLDRAEGGGMTARLEFHYGDTVINPFSSAREPASGQTEDAILIRSVDQERKILNILELAEFNVSQGKIHLDEEEKIFAFAVNWLPELQELAEIYYSDDFVFKVRPATSFSGRIALDENMDLLEVSFDYGDIDPKELGDIFASLQVKKKYHRLRDGSFLNLNQAELLTVAELLENLDLEAADLGEKTLNLPKFRAMYIDSFLRQANLPGMQRNKAFKQLVQSIIEPQDSEFEIPSGLSQVLRDYQKTGFKWLKTLASFGLGGILADDMGLGKTLQVLSFILSEKEANPGPALVIAPTSLIYNWQEEAKKFTPELKVMVVDGTPLQRQEMLADLPEWDLVVASYPILRRDIDSFAKFDFSYCFLDEAQHIKNPQTLNARSVQEIKAKGYFALTGTPIENSLSELWSIFNFIMPGYLLSHQEFRKKYEIPIVKGEDRKPLKELSRHVNPFILRRLKADVLKELPEKIETRLNAALTAEQKKMYLAYLQDARSQIAREISRVGFERSHIKILAALTRLRQICCHPAMFVENYGGESGKMLLFQEVLADALDSCHRILVFSQFTTMLDIIQNYLNLEGIEHFYLNGTTRAAERTQMANSFNAGKGKVFLISLKAGGTGLNLTGADMVVHFDPWWNPAVEEQATDRAHRIGQKSAVQVIKLITQGTVEEKVCVLQEKKKGLINAVIQPGETLLSKLSEEELRMLFDLTEG